jgi:hypothetical protein
MMKSGAKSRSIISLEEMFDDIDHNTKSEEGASHKTDNQKNRSRYKIFVIFSRKGSKIDEDASICYEQ